jgi:hypothetical protein
MEVAASPRWGIPMSCLRRTLALRARLSRMGVKAALVYGARKAADGLAAHAWLDVGGIVIDTYGTSSQFQPFRRYRR